MLVRTMCGRYEAGQKQKIAEAFQVSVTLEDHYSVPTLSALQVPYSRSSALRMVNDKSLKCGGVSSFQIGSRLTHVQTS
ncbi:hypothetical protein HDF11_000618 [Tunturiibacter psychrotolerans]